MAAALPAVGVARGVAGVRPLAGVVDLFAHGRRAGFERGDGRQRLQGRAGGVFSLRGAVPHRLQGIGGELCKVLTERREGIGRIRRKRQHVARADLHDGHGRAAVDAVGFCHGRDSIFERLLHLCLKVDVDRQRHGGAGLRLDGVELAGDLAGVVVEGHKALARVAVEIFFKGALRARDANDARERVAVLVLIVVPVLNAAGVAEDVGGIVGLIDAHGRGIHLHAGIVAILDEGNERNIHVARKFEGRGAVHLGGGEGVAQPDERAHRGIRERFVDPVLAAQLQIQRRARQSGGETVIADVLFIDPLERDEVFDERFRAAVRGVVGVGRGPGERKRVLNFDAPCVHQFDDAQQRVVELVGRDERGIKIQRVDRTVRHEHFAVAVGENAARALDRFDLGIRAHGLGEIIVAVDDLRVKERDNEYERAEKHRRAERDQAAGKAFGIHSGLLSLRLGENGGKSVGEDAADGAQRRIDRQKKQARERRFAREQVQHRQNGC